MHAADEVPDDEDPESFYGEDIFDDIIAKAMEAESKMESAPTNTNSERIAVKGTPGDLENRQSNRGTGNDYSYGSAPEHDAASLDSGEISGESDISAMDAEHGENGKTNPYNPSPLVNDDESTIDMRPPAPNNQTVSSYVDQLNRSERSKGRLIKAGSFAICIAIVVGVVLAVISLTGNKDGATGNVGRISDNAQVSTGGRLPGAEKEKSLAPAASSMAAFAIIPVPVTASFPVTAPPTRPPTERPAMASSTETIHPVQLTFENIPSGYKLLEKDRTPIVDFIEELLSDHMDESFELLEVAYARANAGERSRRSLQRQVESFSIPLRIVVRGPSNFSQDFKQSYVMEKIQERSNDIVNYLKAYNWKTFNNVRISEVVEFDIADLVDPTVSPMMSPVQSVQPIRSPSQTPSGKTVGVTQPPILTRTAPPVTNEPTQKPTQYTIAAIVTTSSPVTNVPTRRPTRRPTRYPTGRPTKRPTSTPTPDPTPVPTPVQTPRPTRNPTRNPTRRPSLRPTRRPTRRPVASPSTVIAPYGTAAGNTPGSNPTLNTGGSTVNQGPVLASTPSGNSDGYFCAKTSYTAGWNILLDFKCDTPCPSKAHADCLGDQQCHVSDYCQAQNNGGRR